MSSVAEASTLLRKLVADEPTGTKIKGLIDAAAKKVGWKFSRTKDVWYRDARRIDAHEMDRLRDVLAKREADALRQQLAGLRTKLAATDPQLHRPTIDALECALRQMGGSVDAVGFRSSRRVTKQVALNVKA